MNDRDVFSYDNVILGEEVAEALNEKKPVVAIETGYLAHKEKKRNHIEDAKEIVKCICENNAVPAIVAVCEGKLKIGLFEKELELFLGRNDLVKCNMRDICAAVFCKTYGTTTISATLHAAKMAGIQVVTAGGIGGVHRGGQKTFDISPDLNSIAYFPGVVVCSGVKSILDIPLTMEYMETLGISVVGYNTDRFPAYYVQKSDIPLEHVCYTPQEAAFLLKSKQSVGDMSGMIMANPIRKEASQNSQVIEEAIAKALEKAEVQKVQGKAITLFLLNEVEKQIGDSLPISSFYIKRDNAELAAKIAVALGTV